MPIPNIPSAPPAPTQTDPENFNAKADTFLAWLCNVFVAALNATIDAMNGLIQFPPAGYVSAATPADILAGTATDKVITPSGYATVKASEAGKVDSFYMRTAPTGWLKCNGASITRSAYPNLFNAITQIVGNVAISIASPAVVTLNSHGLINGDCISFETSGSLPGGLAPGTNYFVINSATNTFQVSATMGGSAINTTGTQSGTHSVRYNPAGVTDLTHFNVPELRGEFLRGADDGRGIDSGRNIGSFQADLLRSHVHLEYYNGLFYNATGGYSPLAGSGWGNDNYNTSATGGAETRPRNISVLWCIKY